MAVSFRLPPCRRAFRFGAPVNACAAALLLYAGYVPYGRMSR